MSIKKLLISASTAMALIFAGNIHAAVLDFDDTSGSLKSTYGGFNFTLGGSGTPVYNMAITGQDDAPMRSAKSGTNILASNGGTLASLTMTRTSGSAFDFKGGYFANWKLDSASNSSLSRFNSSWVQFTGYNKDGSVAATSSKTLGDWAWMDIGFNNIFKLSIKTDNLSLLVDDFTFSSADVTEVPIPAAALLFAPALVGFMGLRRKLKASA